MSSRQIKVISTGLLILSTLITAVNGALNPNPNTVIPRTNESLKGNPVSWENATVIRIFTTDSAGGNRQIFNTTTLYLQHDGKNLYARWVCYDNKRLKKNGYRTLPTDDLTLDESVQIVLGTPGVTNRKNMEMGGYDNAQGVALAPVAHYYEFTVNVAGTVSRSYNETLLPNPHFSAKVTRMRHNKGWYADMTIPWKAAGIDPSKNAKIYFNAFRFNHSIRYGWLLPAFGNYAAMPFGNAVLTGTPIIEPRQTGIPVPVIRNTPVKTNASISAVKLEYYPLSRKLCGVFPPDAGKQIVSIKVPALKIEKSVRLSNLTSTIVTLVVQKLSEGTKIVASANMADGKSITREFTALDAPDWYGTRAGIDYIDKTVPFPWSQPHWEKGTVKLAHGEIKFGNAALPEQITVKGQHILRAPVTARIKLSGRKAAEFSGDKTKVKVEPTRIDLRTSNPGKVEMRNTIDFDGFMVWRLRLNNIDTRKLEELTLTFPLAKYMAKYVNRGFVQGTVVLGGYGYKGNSGPVWVGNESIGIGVSSDKNTFFSPPDGRQVEVIRKSDGEMDLVLHLVTAAGQVPVPNGVFQLLIIPTPSRPQIPPPMQPELGLWFENWSDYQGYPDMTKLEMVKKRAAAEHKAGKKLYLYFSQCLAENSPGYSRYGIEWVAPPDRPWYRRAYDPGKGVPCHVCCFREATGDLLLDRIQKLAQKADLDGVYLDGTGNPFDCANPSHDCDDSRAVNFDDDVRSGRIIGHRQFLKRLRGIFNNKKLHYPLWLHTGGALEWNTLSLADFFFEGEQLARYRNGYLLEPEKFLVGYSGKAFGFRTLFLPVLYTNAIGIRKALSWSLVHDVEIFLGPDQYKSKVEDVFFSFPRKNTDAHFYPYWEEQKHIRRLSKDNAFISYYRSEHEAIIVAANLRYVGLQKVKLGLDKMFNAAVDRVEEPGSDKQYELKDSILEFEVPEGGFRIFRVSDDGIITKPRVKIDVPQIKFKPIKGYHKEDWQILNAAANIPIPGSNLPLKVAGVQGGQPGIIKLIRQLPGTFTARLKLCHKGSFRIKINDLDILLGSLSGWVVEGTSDGDFLGNCPAVSMWPNGGFYSLPQKELPLDIAIKDGRITLIYNNRHILDNVLLSHPEYSYNLHFEVWDGEWLMLGVDSIVPQMTLKPEKKLHPVR